MGSTTDKAKYIEVAPRRAPDSQPRVDMSCFLVSVYCMGNVPLRKNIKEMYKISNQPETDVYKKQGYYDCNRMQPVCVTAGGWLKILAKYRLVNMDSALIIANLEYENTLISQDVTVKDGYNVIEFKIPDTFKGFDSQVRRLRLLSLSQIDERIITIYRLPGLPNKPWDISKRDDYQNPWENALAMLLKWKVKGVSDFVTISESITNYVFSSCKLAYDHEGGGSSKFTNVDTGDFKCNSFIKHATKIFMKSHLANCVDTAAIVSTFANLLGADLYQIRFMRGTRCNKVISIGGSMWQYPFPRDKRGDLLLSPKRDGAVSGGYGFHEIAFNKAFSTDSYKDRIFDACLRVDENALQRYRLLYVYKDNKGKTLPGVELIVCFVIEAGRYDIIGEYITDKDGQISINEVRQGWYVFLGKRSIEQLPDDQILDYIYNRPHLFVGAKNGVAKKCTNLQFAEKDMYSDSLTKVTSEFYSELLVLNTKDNLNTSSVTGYGYYNPSGRRTIDSLDRG